MLLTALLAAASLATAAGAPAPTGPAAQESVCFWLFGLKCVFHDVEPQHDANASCPGNCVAVVAVSGSGDARTSCAESDCNAAAVAPQGSAESPCENSADCPVTIAVGGKGAEVVQPECHGRLCLVSIAIAGEGDGTVACASLCSAAALSVFGSSKAECESCTATTAVAGEGNAEAKEAKEGWFGQNHIAIAAIGNSNASCANSCEGLVMSSSPVGDASGYCARVCTGLVSTSAVGNATAYQDCRAAMDCVIVALSGTGTARSSADCRSGCVSVEAVSLLGDASSHCDGCAPLALAGDGAHASCRFDHCRPLAVGVSGDASASCKDCDSRIVVPMPGAAVSLFGDASTSCSGDCRRADYVAVSGTGRADGEHAVSGCETGESVGTGVACARPGIT